VCLSVLSEGIFRIWRYTFEGVRAANGLSEGKRGEARRGWSGLFGMWEGGDGMDGGVQR
jgi:hypothetical protein